MVRCLIVDDNANNRLVARYIFEDLHCDVTEANSAHAAHEELAKDGIDMVLLDWMMPQMDGIAFLKSLRADVRHKNLKVVMCSAKEGEAGIATAMEAGANAWLPKPITFDAAQKILKDLGLGN